ncbi:NPCBM-associated, NEW3 domain of alpha-galactosidase family protein, partial [Vibrio parahaemolyticus EKP-028]
KIQ